MSLLKYENKKYSQNGEDGIIEYLISLIYDNPKDKYFLEIGVENGSECNTRNLKENYNWQGVMIDGGYEDFSRNLFKHFVTKDNIIEILNRYNIPNEINLLGIDIDYNDFYVLKEILKKYTCDIVVVEYNATHSPLEDKIVLYNENTRWDGTDYFGASLLSYTKLMNSFSYSLVYTDSKGVNAFFIRDALTLNKLENINNVAKLYNLPKYGPGFNGGHPKDTSNREYTEFNQVEI